MSDFTDITWSAMSGAGIDIDLVSIHPSGLGGHEYILTSGDLRVAFGPAHDEAGNSAEGWDICAYNRVTDENGEYWDDYRQDYVATVPEVFATVKTILGA